MKDFCLPKDMAKEESIILQAGGEKPYKLKKQSYKLEGVILQAQEGNLTS